MTTEPKCLLGWCLPGCVPWPCTGHQWPRRGCNECSVDHAPGCPNAPKVTERCPQCKHKPHGTICFNGEGDGDCGCNYGKPAPAPEPKQGSKCVCGDEYMLGCCEVHDKPKQGSEEPITDHALECWHGIYTMSRNEAKWFNEACYSRIVALRAEVEELKAMLPPGGRGAGGPFVGEGSWSVFAGKVVEERDALRAQLAEKEAELASAREEIAKLRFPPIVVPPEGSPGRQGG